MANQIVKTNEKATSLVASKEQQTLLPIADQYMTMFPEIMQDKTFNAKQAMISLALKLHETKSAAGEPAIDACTHESIMQVAQEVLVKKLDPLKSQCALIVRGNKLTLQAQYQGNVKRAKELHPEIADFHFKPIYKGDTFDLIVTDNGSYEIKNHKTAFKNISKDNIEGGYVKAVDKDGKVLATEIMTYDQIKVSWSQSSSSQAVHKKFPLQMIKKTILNSMCSWLINTTGEVEIEPESFDDKTTNLDPNMEIQIDDSQDFVEAETTPIEVDEDGVIVETEVQPEEEWGEDEMNEVFEDLEAEENNEEEQVVPYGDWIIKYKPTGEWEQVKGTYDKTEKTVKIRRTQK